MFQGKAFREVEAFLGLVHALAGFKRVAPDQGVLTQTRVPKRKARNRARDEVQYESRRRNRRKS